MKGKTKKESIHFLIPVLVRRRLESEAKKNGVTMSWIIRALIRKYRETYPEPPRTKRPRRLREPHVRFSLKLYGDKQEILTYARSIGGEFSSFIREILEMWVSGSLRPDLESSRTVKTVKKFQIGFNGVASVTLKKAIFYREGEFYPKSRENNIWLMELGLGRPAQTL